MGYRGLALGTSIAALFNAGLLLFLLSRHLDGLDGSRVLDSLLRIVLARRDGLAAAGLDRVMLQAWCRAHASRRSCSGSACRSAAPWPCSGLRPTC